MANIETVFESKAQWHYLSDSLTHRQFDIYAVGNEGKPLHVCTVNNLSPEKLRLRDPQDAIKTAKMISATPKLLDALKHIARLADPGSDIEKVAISAIFCATGKAA